MNQIIFVNKISKTLFSFLSRYSKILVLSDENTHIHCYPLIKEELPKHHIISIPAGEKEKNIFTCQYIWKKMIEIEMDRHAVLLNLGGGVIGDMGGFCAASYKRGIDFVQIPTTLLAQVDASIGGKLGIDFEDIKNSIGCFEFPQKAIICDRFLNTLPLKQIRSGYAEVIKYALISDKEMWREIGKNETLENIKWGSLIEKSVKIKNNIVEQDPKEKNIRKLLNFGHTVGHALESYFLHISSNKENSNQRMEEKHTPLLHGEAVAVGMICEAWLSMQNKYLKEEKFIDIENKIRKIFPFVEIEKKDIMKIKKYVLQDKKNINKEIHYIALEDIGKALYNIPVTWENILASIEYYLHR